MTLRDYMEQGTNLVLPIYDKDVMRVYDNLLPSTLARVNVYDRKVMLLPFGDGYLPLIEGGDGQLALYEAYNHQTEVSLTVLADSARSDIPFVSPTFRALESDTDLPFFSKVKAPFVRLSDFPEGLSAKQRYDLNRLFPCFAKERAEPLTGAELEKLALYSLRFTDPIFAFNQLLLAESFALVGKYKRLNCCTEGVSVALLYVAESEASAELIAAWFGNVPHSGTSALKALVDYYKEKGFETLDVGCGYDVSSTATDVYKKKVCNAHRTYFAVTNESYLPPPYFDRETKEWILKS